MRYAFGDYVFDPMLIMLMHKGAQLTVPRRVYACLTYLIEHRERVIKRDELIRKVWGRDNVSDHQMAQVIRAARQALGDDGNCQCMIRTVMGVGYHWAAEVVELSGSEMPAFRALEPGMVNSERVSEPAVAPFAHATESPIAHTTPSAEGEAPIANREPQIAIPSPKAAVVATSQRLPKPNPRLRLALAMAAGALLGIVGTHQVMLSTTIEAPSDASLQSFPQLGPLPTSDETLAQEQVQFKRTDSPTRR